jgi:hypothetical protein
MRYWAPRSSSERGRAWKLAFRQEVKEREEREERERERERCVALVARSYRIQQPSLLINLLQLGEEHALESPHFFFIDLYFSSLEEEEEVVVVFLSWSLWKEVTV